MEFNLKKVKQSSSQEIFKILLPKIDVIYKDYDFIGLSKEEYHNLVLKEIECSKEKYNGEIFYNVYLVKRINLKLAEKVKQLLMNAETSVDIVVRYIDSREELFHSKSSIRYFKNLDTFFNDYKYTPNPDFLIDLITKNSHIKQKVEDFFNRYRLQIIQGQAEKICDNDILLQLVDTYCMLEKIEIDIPQENVSQREEKDDYYSNDDFKMYLREITRIPLLSHEEALELLIRAKQGDEKAKQKFIESNLRLVVSNAKKYVGKGMSLQDLVQEGNLGLLRAYEGYDCTKGFTFSTYATNWIKQGILRALANKSRTIRLPAHLYQQVGMYLKTKSLLEMKLSRTPTIEEIAKEMDISLSKVKKFEELSHNTSSINTLVGSDEDTELGDLIASAEETPDEIAVENSLQTSVKDLLDKCGLSEREKLIITLRYGLGGKKPKTLEAVGTRLKLTRERVRQLEAKAIKKLRNSRYIKDLAVYMNFPEQAIKNIDMYRNLYNKSSGKNKAYLREYNQTEKGRKDDMKNTIYEQFEKYTREEVQNMLSKLTAEEMRIVTLRFGNDLDTPMEEINWNEEDQKKYYGTILSVMKRLLKNPNTTRRTRKQNNQNTSPKTKTTHAVKQHSNNESQSFQTFNNENSEAQSSAKPAEDESFNQDGQKESGVTEELQLTDSYAKEETLPVVAKPECKQLFPAVEEPIYVESSSETLQILEAFRPHIFSHLIEKLSPKELMIISLKLGYIDGECFSTDRIAEFLNIEPNEVRDITKRVLISYKEQVNLFFDQVIDVVTDDKNDNKTFIIQPVQNK